MDKQIFRNMKNFSEIAEFEVLDFKQIKKFDTITIENVVENELVDNLFQLVSEMKGNFNTNIFLDEGVLKFILTTGNITYVYFKKYENYISLEFYCYYKKDKHKKFECKKIIKISYEKLNKFLLDFLNAKEKDNFDDVGNISNHSYISSMCISDYIGNEEYIKLYENNNLISNKMYIYLTTSYYLLYYWYLTILLNNKLDNRKRIIVESPNVLKSSISESQNVEMKKNTSLKANIITIGEDIKVYTKNFNLVKQIKKREFKGYSHSFTVSGHIRHVRQKDGSIKEIHVKPYIKGKGKEFKPKRYKLE